MLIPENYETLAAAMTKGKVILFFTADWCGDCVVIKPHMPNIEAAFPDYTFIQVDRDAYIDLCQKWDIFGIPSFIGLENGEEKGRFVSKNRKTKEEIVAFIESL